MSHQWIFKRDFFAHEEFHAKHYQHLNQKKCITESRQLFSFRIKHSVPYMTSIWSLCCTVYTFKIPSEYLSCAISWQFEHPYSSNLFLTFPVHLKQINIVSRDNVWDAQRSHELHTDFLSNTFVRYFLHEAISVREVKSTCCVGAPSPKWCQH